MNVYFSCMFWHMGIPILPWIISAAQQAQQGVAAHQQGHEVVPHAPASEAGQVGERAGRQTPRQGARGGPSEFPLVRLPL
jgi:hypothetical protein